jgi:hypothetical protein
LGLISNRFRFRQDLDALYLTVWAEDLLNVLLLEMSWEILEKEIALLL